MSNTFWAVFLGAALGMFTVNLATALVEEWQHKQSHKRMRLMLEELEDAEFEEYDE
jgi:hypothetical protein